MELTTFEWAIITLTAVVLAGVFIMSLFQDKEIEAANPNTADRLLERNCALVDQVNELQSELEDLTEKCRVLSIKLGDAEAEYNAEANAQRDFDALRKQFQETMDWIIQPQLERAYRLGEPVKVPWLYPDIEYPDNVAYECVEK